ncbi:MAG: hypothetical protein IT379_08630 [Deltaproteobacteria bacterium]|nr:hypothetical protein [Deltaproteobacteria bacterium]
MCRDQGLCVRVVTQSEITPGGTLVPGDRVALRTCDGDEDCPTGIRCDVQQRCIPRNIGGCRCDVAGRRPSTGLARAAWLVLAGLSAFRRLSRRGPTHPRARRNPGEPPATKVV